ncbi:hypothetical protein [Natronorubrum sulfidifaciens]|uniref:Uncharacterized protein n=1 Tax=Natronorubrum sulfidifaciens JCM 14089 TaxID=1230460 RepID=L9WE78_9EURY|nr:hypothetical protein [Natronorubrum sulfidifaciens]ELY46613.1 hypothetical protein C495_05883 [Natronorubrum sulfidifaciens JCM 14089]
MSETTLETIEQLLEGAAEETTNAEVRYKLNSARQLLKILEHRDDAFDETVHAVVDDEKTLAQLRELGYLD